MNHPITKRHRRPSSTAALVAAPPRLASLRLEPWPHDPTTALIAQRDHLGRLDPADLRHAIDLATQRGYRTLRTSALLEGPTQTAVDLGFQIIDSLLLLTRTIGTDEDLSPPAHRVRRLHRFEDGRAARIDTAAFGEIWGNDRRGLVGVRRATDRHEALATGRLGRPTGFVVVGIGATGPAAAVVPGYLQRLAVAPEHRRLGLGDALVIAALRWLRQRHVTIATVNTGVDNEPALQLYRNHGFAPSGSLMHVAEFHIDGHREIGVSSR
jgi:GNAT superfamily N-acetyltransferase